MKVYQQMMTRQRKWMIYLLALFILGWGVTPWQPIFLGLLLGGALSFYNLWMMQRKIHKLGEVSIDSTSAKKTSNSLGTITRLASGALAVVIALQYEEHLHMIAVVLGLMTAYIVILIDYLFNKSTD